MTQDSMVSFNEDPWLKNVLFTENGASYDTLLCYWYSRNFIKLQIIAPAKSTASIFQPDLEHESGAIHELPTDGKCLSNFYLSVSYPNVSPLIISTATVR